MNEDKATRYHRLKRWLSVASLAWSVVLLGGLIVSGTSSALAWTAGHLAGSWLAPGVIERVTARSIYLVLVALMNAVVALPLDFYGSYIVEHRYNLSTESIGHWLRQQGKGSAVSGLLGLVAFNLLYLAIDHWPRHWWLPAAAGFAAIIILIANLFPVLLLPIFYRVTPLSRETLRTRLLALADRARMPAVNAFEWHLGARTKKANAMLAGLGRTRRILVSDTLLADYSDEEIEVILAHELGHHAHADIWRGIAFEAVLSLVGFYVAARLLDGGAHLAGLSGPWDIAGLPLLLLALGAVSLILVPAANALSRWQERRADAYALRLTENHGAFISAMRRLAAQNLAEEHPSTLARLLFYTHPPVSERIAAARRLPPKPPA
jgi:STE24 endopeptidase